MPFQSEKQRRYLWANEPEIARDWADTYGSRIEKNTGGISQLVKSGLGRPGYAGPHDNTGGTDYGKSTPSRGMSPGEARARGLGAQHHGSTSSGNLHAGNVGEGGGQGYVPGIGPIKAPPVEKKPVIEKKDDSFFTKLKNKHDLKRRKDWALQYMKKNPHPMGFIWDDWTDEDFLSDTNLQALKDTGYLKGAGSMNQGGGGGIRYPQNIHPGTEVTDVTEVIEEEGPSKFQQSIAGGPDLPFKDYYVGGNPTAANIAWGEDRVDPRTMDMTSFAANGGRIPAAFGGIMDSSTGRRAYGFGSIFKSIKKAAGKVLKSPIGKAALLGGLGAYGMGWGRFGDLAGSGFLRNLGTSNLGKKLFMKNTGTWALPKYDSGVSLAKLGVLTAPLLATTKLGEVPDDEGEGFDYMGAKNAYAKELLRLKKEANERSLDPNEWNYLGVPAAEGGRIGYYAGGQSIPSDYTMEDAMMTTTQDKLGGITDVMKQADLYRQGSVGQFYAAHGGSADAKLMARIKELQDEGLDYNSARAQAEKEAQGKAQGGRIGAQEGGLMDLGGMEKDYRNDGGFVPLGGEEKADDVPARLSKNEFVFTADAVRGAGGGDIDKGAEIMENIMKNLEQGGQISDETQGLSGAQEMFSVSERLSEVV